MHYLVRHLFCHCHQIASTWPTLGESSQLLLPSSRYKPPHIYFHSLLSCTLLLTYFYYFILVFIIRKDEHRPCHTLQSTLFVIFIICNSLWYWGHVIFLFIIIQLYISSIYQTCTNYWFNFLKLIVNCHI